MFFFPIDFHKKAVALDKKINRLGAESERSLNLRRQRKRLWEEAGAIDLLSFAMQDMPLEGIASLFGEISTMDYMRFLRRKLLWVKKRKICIIKQT